MTTTFASFLVEVIPYVPNVMDYVAVNAVRNSAIEFCEKTRIWQFDSFKDGLSATSADYTPDVPPNTRLVDIIQVWVDGRLMIPKTSDELTRLYRGQDWRNVGGVPGYMTRRDHQTITLVPYPTVASVGNLTMRVSVAPMRSAADIDTDLYENYLEAICMGARARLYETPDQPYSSQPMAAECWKRFRKHIGDTKIKLNKGLTRGPMRVEFQRF